VTAEGVGKKTFRVPSEIEGAISRWSDLPFYRKTQDGRKTPRRRVIEHAIGTGALFVSLEDILREKARRGNGLRAGPDSVTLSGKTLWEIEVTATRLDSSMPAAFRASLIRGLDMMGEPKW
jgi:hypothetical protein